jgi:hypothetical protein
MIMTKIREMPGAIPAAAAGALHGIESVKENAPGAEVDDQTGE